MTWRRVQLKTVLITMVNLKFAHIMNSTLNNSFVDLAASETKRHPSLPKPSQDTSALVAKESYQIN